MTFEEKRGKLTPIQKRFCEEYVIDFLGNKAYQRATDSDNLKSCGVSAAKLLKLPKIQAYIEEYTQETLGPRQKRLKENVQFWEEIRDDKNNSGAMRLKASENLAKWDQLFVEKKEVAVEERVVIVDDIK